jgi:formylglycine-generating enzyme required for sulfatase activity
MEATITLQGIDQAISDLNYRNPKAQKCRLVHVIRAAYDGGQPPQFIKHIDPKDLIKALWDTENDQAAVKARRKTLSSTKSAVNKDLKELFRQGKNPEGITIGRDNVFVMSDEAKDRLLADFGPESAREKAASLRQIAESLNAIKEILRAPEILSDPGGAGASPVLDDLRNTLRHLAQEVGTGESQGPKAQTGSQISKTDVGGSSSPGLTGREPATTPGKTKGAASVKGIKEGAVQDKQGVEQILEVTDQDAVVENLQPDEPAQQDDITESLQEVDEDEVVEEILEQDQEDIEEILEEVDDAVELAETEDAPGVSAEAPVAQGGAHGVGGEMEGAGGVGEDGLVPRDLENGLDDGEEDDTDKARRLAEAFDGQLRTMERFYNQYLLIPEGEYTVGNPTPGKDEQSERKVQVAPFYMGKFPVTNALFEVFVEKTGYVTTAEKVGHGVVYYGRLRKEVDDRTGLVRFTSFATIQSRTVPGACWFQPLGPGSNLHGKRNHPVVQVSLEDAMAFAAWTGKRLPTEEEWEASARTGKGLVLPWGNDWIADACNTEESAVAGTTPVDQFEERANEFGMADMLGNVMEWTSNPWQAGSASGNGTAHVAKGGGWISGKEIRLCSRFKVDSGSTSNVLGFRCVAS